MTTSPAELTDVGNSDRFVREDGDDLRFVGTWGRWVTSRDSHWSHDETGDVIERAKTNAKRFFQTAAAEFSAARESFDRAMAVGDDSLAMMHRERLQDPKRRYGWALDSLKSSRIKAMVDLARSAPELAVTHHQLDADPWLLNVANGTIDLRTGTLRDHRREDLITKLAPVHRDPRATCPTWEAFLAYAQAGNSETIDFLQRAVGYCLTGVIREHVLLFLYGPAGTGKSTFFRVMHAILGNYATRAPRSLLFKAHGEKHPTELTTLDRARFVSCNEVDEGASFDEALVKDLTGGEEISARRMREDFWSFAPTHKLAIGGNHKPRVRNFDDAIRRRVRLVPWTVKPATMDTSLFDRLVAELPGILNWAVRGCLAWQRDGLGEPAIVREATDAYQDESDPLREFFELHCVFEADATVARKYVRTAYEEYCDENGAKPLDAKPFAAGLRRRGVADARVRAAGKACDGWRGVRLATEAERDRGVCRPVTSSPGDDRQYARELHISEKQGTGLHTSSRHHATEVAQ